VPQALHELLTQAGRPNHLIFQGDAGELTWAAAAEQVAMRAAELSPGQPLAITAGGAAGLIDLLAASTAGALPLLVPAGMTAAEAEAAAEGVAASIPGVVIFTSGTSGRPKAALHHAETLLARVHRAPALADARWLLAYPIAAFAGLQVVLSALANGSTLILAEGDPGRRLAAAAAAGATHISATPTFFRLALATASDQNLDVLCPLQLTLGGEVVDQPVLDALRTRFPSARITHIYASTEMGACFSVHDGRAGFPAAYLAHTEGVRLRIEDGELHIFSPFAMRGYVGGDPQAGWYATGDRVEQVGDRVYFTGRTTERINVGGRKVAPARVEAAVLAVPGVLAVRVSGRPSALAGQIVQAHVVPLPGTDEAALRLAILQTCQQTLQNHEVPRTLRFVASLPQTATGKLARTDPSTP